MRPAMRGDAKLASDINEKWLKEQYNDWQDGHFAGYYNQIVDNTFQITDKVILDKYDPENKYINRIQRQYTYDWKKEYDNGIYYDFPAELMNFSVNAKGEIIAELTDEYLKRKDMDIPAVKYCYFFIKDNEIRLTVPNQADDGRSIAYINGPGELIIDNDL